MSSTYLAQGIVLARHDYREVDRIVTIFTDEYGKIDAVARGVRKPLSKLAGHLEPFSYSSFMLATGRTFDVLATSVKLSSFRIPQSDVLSFALATYFFEATDRLTRQRQPDRALFGLLVRFLELFEASLDPHGGSPAFQRVLLTEFFLFRLIHHLGFAPLLDRCALGKELLGTDDLAMSTAHGGFVCREHRTGNSTAQAISPQTVEILRLMADGHLEALRFVQ
ncbi:MAG: DNA repair protein RecO, partial [bacterium]